MDCKAEMKRDLNSKCHHHVTVEDAELGDYKNQVNDIVCLMGENFVPPPLDICYVELLNSGRAGDGTADPKSIWFEPKMTIEKMAFSKSINDDLRLRDMGTLVNLEVRRARLFQRMEIKAEFMALQASINHCTHHHNAFVDVAKLIPCILHLEMRCGLKKWK
jgi:hypothetical protein